MSAIQVDFGVTEKQGVPVVSSRKVAAVFEKRHDNILADVKGIVDGLLKIQESAWKENFIPSFYRNEQNKKQPEFLLTKKGFTLLAMGFTGKKALKFKVAYINRFEEMENFINELHIAKTEFPEFTEAILALHEAPKPYHFSNECDMINRIVLGMSAKQFRELHGIDKSKSIRAYLQPHQLEAVRKLQRIDIGLMLVIPDFEERKQVLKSHFDKLQNKNLLKAM